MAGSSTLTTDALRGLVRPTHIHRRVYTDPQVFEAEMDSIFGNAWLYVAHESRLPGAGDFVRTRMGRHEVLVIRDTNNAIHVLVNSCKHRGARLCTAAQGNRKTIVCPYHGWTYRPDGSLVSVPHPDSYGSALDLSDSANGLKRAPCVDSYRGFVFARWAPDGPTLTEFLGAMTSAIDNLIDRAPDSEIEAAGGTFSSVYPGNWKLHMENANDTVHPSFVHASSVASARLQPDATEFDGGVTWQQFASNGFTEQEWTQLELRGFQSGHCYMGGFYKDGVLAVDDDDPATRQYREAMVASHGEQRTAEILGMDRFQNLIYPSIALNAQYHQLRVVYPLAADRTLIHSQCFRLKGAPAQIFERAVRFHSNISSPASVIFGDDMEIFARCQDGLSRDGTEWINVQRGVTTDIRRDDGAVDSPGASELNVRAQFTAWLRYMTQDAA